LTEVATAYGAVNPARALGAWRGLRPTGHNKCGGKGYQPRALFQVADERTGQGLAETILLAAWRKAGLASAVVGSRNGHTYRIIDPGDRQTAQGPSFGARSCSGRMEKLFTGTSRSTCGQVTSMPTVIRLTAHTTA
jgi:hypothetical protein